MCMYLYVIISWPPLHVHHGRVGGGRRTDRRRHLLLLVQVLIHRARTRVAVRPEARHRRRIATFIIASSLLAPRAAVVIIAANCAASTSASRVHIRGNRQRCPELSGRPCCERRGGSGQAATPWVMLWAVVGVGRGVVGAVVGVDPSPWLW